MLHQINKQLLSDFYSFKDRISENKKSKTLPNVYQFITHKIGFLGEDLGHIGVEPILYWTRLMAAPNAECRAPTAVYGECTVGNSTLSRLLTPIFSDPTSHLRRVVFLSYILSFYTIIWRSVLSLDFSHLSYII